MAAMGVFQRHTLSNGLRVLTAPMPQAQSVSCFVMLAAGSRYETAETNGIAHFAEHMFFKGTEQRPTARDIAGEVDAIGGEFNAFTGKEYTGYYIRCAADTRDTALDVLVDMLRRSKFDPDEIEREKGVIVEEMNMYFDTPRDFIGGVYEDLLYGDQPLGWHIIGRKETVRGATRDTFTDYVDSWYRAERMVVGIGGKIGDGLHERLEELLGDVPAGSPDGPRRRRAAAQRLAREGAHEGLRPGPPRARRPEPAVGRSRPLRPPAARERPRRRHVLASLHRGAGATRARLLRLQHEPLLHGHGLALRAVGRRHQPDRRRREDDRGAVRAARVGAGAAGRAREGAQLLEGALRAPAREPARDDHVRPPPRGARGPGGGARGGARGARRRHGRGHPARRARRSSTRVSTWP